MQVRWNSHPILVRLESELEDLRSRRQFRQLGAMPGINLCSNDYLGLSEDPRIRLAVLLIEKGDAGRARTLLDEAARLEIDAEDARAIEAARARLP